MKNEAGPAVARDDGLEAGKHRRLSCREVMLGHRGGVLGDEDTEGEMEKLSRTKTLVDGGARGGVDSLQGTLATMQGAPAPNSC
jgi:hypothetical protein